MCREIEQSYLLSIFYPSKREYDGSSNARNVLRYEEFWDVKHQNQLIDWFLNHARSISQVVIRVIIMKKIN